MANELDALSLFLPRDNRSQEQRDFARSQERARAQQALRDAAQVQADKDRYSTEYGPFGRTMGAMAGVMREQDPGVMDALTAVSSPFETSTGFTSGALQNAGVSEGTSEALAPILDLTNLLGTGAATKALGTTANILTKMNPVKLLEMAKAAEVAGDMAKARQFEQQAKALSLMPRVASVEKAPLVADGLTQPMVDALSNEARAPMQTGSITDALAGAERKASGQKLMKGKAPEPTTNMIPDRRQTSQTVVSPIEDQQRKMADAMAGRTETLAPAKPQEARSMEQLTQESAQAKRANAATPVNTPKPSSGKVGDAGTSEFERDLFRKRQQDKALETQRLEQEASKVAPERPVPSDLNTPLEPKVSQEEMAKNIRGEAPTDVPVEDIAVKPEAPKKGVVQKVLDNKGKNLTGAAVGATALGAMGSKSERGKPGEVPPPKKGGEVAPAVTPPNLDAEAADLSKRGLDREAEMKQQAAAQSLRPEGTPEEEALKTKQAALDAVMAEGNSLDKQGKGGFWRGVGKFFGDKGPEDFFSYATDTKGYLAKEAQRAKEARMAGNIEETTKINQGLSQLKNFQANLIKANNEVISSIRDNDTKRFVAQLRQKNGDNMMAIALKMSTLPDGTVDYSKMPEAIAKLNAAQSYGKMQGVMQGAQGLPLE